VDVVGVPVGDRDSDTAPTADLERRHRERRDKDGFTPAGPGYRRLTAPDRETSANERRTELLRINLSMFIEYELSVSFRSGFERDSGASFYGKNGRVII